MQHTNTQTEINELENEMLIEMEACEDRGVDKCNRLMYSAAQLGAAISVWGTAFIYYLFIITLDNHLDRIDIAACFFLIVSGWMFFSLFLLNVLSYFLTKTDFTESYLKQKKERLEFLKSISK